MTNSGNSTGSVIVAFALGAVAGAVLALLYAPAAGEETRRKLADKAREGRERAEAAAREGREFVTRQRDAIVETIQRGRDAFDDAREERL